MTRGFLGVAAWAVLAGSAAAGQAEPADDEPSGSVMLGWTKPVPVTDEFQVAWTIPAIPPEGKAVAVERDGMILRTQLVPKHLLVAAQPVRSRDGEVIAAQGTQFLAMDWKSLLVCTLPDTAHPSHDLCLLDEDGDGKPDSFFPGSRGLYGIWFVLNERMPATRSPLQPPHLWEVPADRVARKPSFLIAIMGWPSDKKGFRLGLSVENRATVFEDCPAGPSCVSPPIRIDSVGEGGRRQVRISGLNHPTDLRIWLTYEKVEGPSLRALNFTVEGLGDKAARASATARTGEAKSETDEKPPK